MKFRLKLKKVGKTTRPFWYDLNEIPYDYTVEVTNRLKGLDLTECLKRHSMDGGSWHCTGGSDQDHPQKKRNEKRQNGCLTRPYQELRKEAKGKEEKKGYIHLNAEF